MIAAPNAQLRKTMLSAAKARARFWARPSDIAALGLAGMMAIPIIAVLWALFAASNTATQHIFSTTLPTYILNSVSLMVLVGIIASTIGISTAWLITATSFPGRRILSWALVLPLAAPAYIVAYLYTDLLEFSGPVQSSLRAVTGWSASDYWFPPIRSLLGAALMLGLVLYPYIYLLCRAAFAAQSRSQFQAARALGLNPSQAFLRIVLPGARPAIAGGLALVLMETLADFGVADYFAIPTFSTGIFRTWLAMGEPLGAMKLAGVMLLFVFLLVGLEALGRRGSVSSVDRLSRSDALFSLRGWRAASAIIACSLPVILGFILPMTVLIWLTIGGGDTQPLSAIADYAWNSTRLAVLVAVIATVIALFFAYIERQRKAATGRSLFRVSLRVATLGYALPGALLAIGLLGPIGAIDQDLTRWSRATFGFNHGLLLSGTIALLTYALVIRFLTVSYNSVASGMAKLPPNMDSAARSLGAGPWVVVRDIHRPLMIRSLLAGISLVFIDVMRELPATLILRPFNFETLATRVYRLASDERLAEASTSALIIVLLGLLPVIVLTRLKSD